MRPAVTLILLLLLAVPAGAAAGVKPKAKPKATHLVRSAAPNDPLWSSEWGPRALGLPALWRRASVSRHVVVAVVDSGVDAAQPDLAGVVLPGWNTLTGTDDTRDDVGHGTMVAGVIAARPNNRLGTAGYCSVCKILPVKVLDASGHGPGSAIAAGIDWAAAHGANVINLSLTLVSDDSAVDAAVARAVGAGVLVVAAAGNDGSTTPTYPGVDPGVVSVAADDPAGRLYPWSNSGDWISVAAPGCNLTTQSGTAFGEFCGTSSATAAVSGILGAVLAVAPKPARTLAAAVTSTAAPASRRINAAALLGPPPKG